MTKKIALESAAKLKAMVTDNVTANANGSMVNVVYKDEHKVTCELNTGTLNGIEQIIAILDDLGFIKSVVGK